MFDFAVLQTRYVKAAMDQIPSFRPDGLTPVQVQALIGTAAPVRSTYVTNLAAINGARASRRTSIEELHTHCVDFTAQARSIYRNDPSASELIARLPVQDQTFQETITRADAILALWATLPQIGTPPAEFTYGAGDTDVSQTTFQFLRDTALGISESIPDIDQTFQKAEAATHIKQAELSDFVSAALEQGRSRYADGTAEREIIDAVPTDPAQQAPGQAVITSAAQAGPGTVHLAFDAPHATSFDVLHRVAGGSGDFTLIGQDLIERQYDPTGLAAAQTHEFIVRGNNSRGTGPDSDPSSVPVT